MQYLAVKVSLQWNKTFYYMAFFLARLPCFYNDGFTCVEYRVWYLLEEELLIILIGIAREQAHSSQPSLLVGFGAVEARGWEHWLTSARNRINFLLGACWSTSVCVSVPSYSCCCTHWCSVRNAFPQLFYHSWMQAERARHLQQRYISSPPVIQWSQHAAKYGNRKQSGGRELLHPETVSEINTDSSLGGYGLQNHVKCVKQLINPMCLEAHIPLCQPAN